MAFPDDPKTGRLLMPQYPMTYEKLASYNFDKNAALLYALEIVNSLNRKSKTAKCAQVKNFGFVLKLVRTLL